MSKSGSALVLPPLVTPEGPAVRASGAARSRRGQRLVLADFWITDVDYDLDGTIQSYGLIPAPVWACMVGGRRAAARIRLSPAEVNRMIDGGNLIYTTRKSGDGASVLRGPLLRQPPTG